MFKLRRFYLDSIGVPSNRFVNVNLSFTDDGDSPVDSIALLRNGAGKTTQIALLLAQVLADRSKFLVSEDRKGRKRTLEALVQTGDTAHTACEWEDWHGNRLITGAVYEWKGKTRPRDFDGQNRQLLECRWWCLRPDQTVTGATFDELPFPSVASGKVDQRGFVEHLQALPAQGVDAVVCKQVKEWHDTLRDRGFDPDLFSYFRRINGSEGGVEKLFAKIEDPESFVRFLLELVVETSRAGDVRDLLADTAVEIAKRPAYETDRRFCLEGHPRIDSLGAAYSAFELSTVERDAAYAAASRFKRRLLDTEIVDGERAAIATLEFDELAGQARTANTEAEQNRRVASEYRRIAADMRLADAERAIRYRAGIADRAKTEQQGWEALERLLERRTEQNRLQRQKRALESATEDAEPLRRDIAACEQNLVAVLNRTIADATSKLRELDGYIELMKPEIADLETQESEAVADASRLRSERQADHAAVTRFENRVGRAVNDGALTAASEHPADAVDRLTNDVAAFTAQIAELEGTVTTIGIELDVLGTQRAGADRERQEAEAERRTRQERLDGFQERSDALASSDRLQHLTQSDELDPIAEAADLVDLLSRTVADADRRIVDERVDGADDERAVHALATTGLLPARRAVEQVCSQLTDSGITAFPGWSYLAEHTDPGRHRDAIEAMPDVVDGVVVYGDPHTAASAVTEPPSEPVVIAAASMFTNPGDAVRAVVGPSPARHDRSAAELELAARTAANSERESRIGVLHRQREADADLRERIRMLSKDVGAGGLQPHLAAVERADSKVAGIVARLEGIAGKHADATERARVAAEQLTKARNGKAAAEQQLITVRSLREDFDEVYEPARSRLQSVDERIQAAADLGKSCHDKLAENRDQLGTWQQQRRDVEKEQREWNNRLANFPEVTAAEVGSVADLTLDIAETALKDAHALYEANFPEATLRAAIREAEQRVNEASTKFERYTDAAKARARELVAEPEAADPELRREAHSRASLAAEEENQRLGSARTERESAKAEVNDTRPPEGRKAHAEVPETPADRDHARRLAADANDKAGQLARRSGELEKERDDAKERRDVAERHAQLMRDLADRFTMEPADPGLLQPLTGSDDSVRRDTAALALACTTADSQVNAADKVLRQEGDSLRVWAQQDQYARLSDDDQGRAVKRVRELIGGELLYDRVAPKAAEYRDELVSRAAKITQHIEGVEQTKQNVVSRLVDVATTALDDLGRVSTLSTLPAGIGPWENHRFLIIEPVDGRPTHDQIHVRVADVVERLVATSDAKITLRPVELLQQATIAAAGANGFRASILKPSPEQSVRHVPVDEMSLWSGGEVLTASLVLFCSMAKLRAENRSTSRRHTQAGLIPLDNPLGSANYIEFLHLQRLVAHMNGAQLVYWTGLGDMGAVAAFPRVIPMRKRASLSKPGHEYVTIDAPADETPQTVSAVDAVHPDPWIGSDR